MVSSKISHWAWLPPMRWIWPSTGSMWASAAAKSPAAKAAAPRMRGSATVPATACPLAASAVRLSVSFASAPRRRTRRRPMPRGSRRRRSRVGRPERPGRRAAARTAALAAVEEAEPPQERRAVHHRQAGIVAAHDVALVDLERARGPAAVQLEHGEVPREVAVKGRPAVIAGQPRLEECHAAVIVHGLEADVGDIVARVGIAGILLERALGQPAGLVEAPRLVMREGQRGLKPPVVAVGRGEALEEGLAKLLAVRAPAEADGAAGLVDEERVAGNSFRCSSTRARPRAVSRP